MRLQLAEDLIISNEKACGCGAAPTLREIVVVVPAHNDRDRLPRCLASIAAAAAHVAVPVDVMVVLDSCTDGSESMISAGVRRIEVSARKRRRCAGGRIRRCRAKIGCPDLVGHDGRRLDRALHLVAKPGFHHGAMDHGVVGTVSVDWQEDSATTQRRYDLLYGNRESMHGHVHGANLGVRADTYWRVGGFRPLQVGEDVDLVDRLVSAGAPLAWDTRHAVLTSDRRDCRARGGFGDYVRSLAEDTSAQSA